MTEADHEVHEDRLESENAALQTRISSVTLWA